MMFDDEIESLLFGIDMYRNNNRRDNEKIKELRDTIKRRKISIQEDRVKITKLKEIE